MDAVLGVVNAAVVLHDADALGPGAVQVAHAVQTDITHALNEKPIQQINK